ncbi:MAG: hypothetical protein MUC43_14815 [Pirellula sp.]|jgi:hypothetical protein|nr:hypothetical protein [Pirellula sp.]
MTGRQLVLSSGKLQITLLVQSPTGLDPIDDYREVNFEIPGRGRYRAVFFLLPDGNSDDPYAIKPINEWDVPVRWDDPTMLFVPTLNDDSILAAMRYIIDNGLESDACESDDDLRLNDTQ